MKRLKIIMGAYWVGKFMSKICFSDLSQSDMAQVLHSLGVYTNEQIAIWLSGKHLQSELGEINTVLPNCSLGHTDLYCFGGLFVQYCTGCRYM